MKNNRYVAATTLAGCLWAGGALGSDNFPPVVQDELELPAAPPCLLCHQSEVGGTGTATRPIAVSLQRFGLRGVRDEGALRTALLALEARGDDSDRDGVADTDELRAGTDPNAGETSDVPLPESGCSVRRGRASGSPGAGWWLLLVVGWSLRRGARFSRSRVTRAARLFV